MNAYPHIGTSQSDLVRKRVLGQQEAQRERRAAEESRLAAMGLTRNGNGTVRRLQCPLANVPPWCCLNDGRWPEEAAAEVARRIDMTNPAEVLGLIWKLRQIIAGDIAYQATAEGVSAKNISSALVVEPDTGSLNAYPTNEPTNPSPDGHLEQGEKRCIAPGHRGKTEPAREENEKDTFLASAAKQSPRAGNPINNRKERKA